METFFFCFYFVSNHNFNHDSEVQIGKVINSILLTTVKTDVFVCVRVCVYVRLQVCRHYILIMLNILIEFFVRFVLFCCVLIFIRLHVFMRHSFFLLSLYSIAYFPFQSICISNLFIVISRLLSVYRRCGTQTRARLCDWRFFYFYSIYGENFIEYKTKPNNTELYTHTHFIDLYMQAQHYK